MSGFSIGSLSSSMMMMANAQQNWFSRYNKDEQQLSTGLKVNSPADSPSTWGQIQDLKSRINANPIVQQGLQSGINRDTTMENTLGALGSSASALSNLSVQYAQSGANKTSIESQATSILNSMVNQMANTSFNGNNPFTQGSISLLTNGDSGSISTTAPKFNIVHNATNSSNYDITLNNGTVLSNQTTAQILGSGFAKTNLTDQISSANSSLGTQDTILKDQKSLESSNLTAMNSQLSNLQDVNVAKVTSDAVVSQSMSNSLSKLYTSYSADTSNMIGSLFSALG